MTSSRQVANDSTFPPCHSRWRHTLLKPILTEAGHQILRSTPSGFSFCWCPRSSIRHSFLFIGRKFVVRSASASVRAKASICNNRAVIWIPSHLRSQRRKGEKGGGRSLTQLRNFYEICESREKVGGYSKLIVIPSYFTVSQVGYQTSINRTKTAGVT